MLQVGGVGGAYCVSDERVRIATRCFLRAAVSMGGGSGGSGSAGLSRVVDPVLLLVLSCGESTYGLLDAQRVTQVC
jgi:hypothetical protein